MSVTHTTELTRPLRIALLGSRGVPATYSGFETFYEQLGVRLAARGHQVTVYCRTHHMRQRPPEYRGVRLVHLPSIPTKHLDTISHTLLSLLHSLPRGFDIHYLCIVGNSPLGLLLRLARKRWLFNVDGADAERDKWGGFARRYLRWSERLAARCGDVIIADARVIQRRYRELYGRESVYISYGANVQVPASRAVLTPVLQRFGLEPDGYVLFVSRMTPENGAHVLIEAWRRARTRLRLVLVGAAPYVDEYRERVRRLCGSDVVMTGGLFGDDYREISHGCRFFVLPAGIDGTRPVLLDQMGFGNCVVVKNTAANSEVIGDAGVGYERTDEVGSLARWIERLTDDDATVKRLRQAAVERVRCEYSWERVADQYEALFRDMLAPRHRGRAAT